MDECLLSQECIDQYLWSLYERAFKIDTVSVQESYQVMVKDKMGKEQTVVVTLAASYITYTTIPIYAAMKAIEPAAMWP